MKKNSGKIETSLQCVKRTLDSLQEEAISASNQEKGWKKDIAKVLKIIRRMREKEIDKVIHATK
ncbi:MAG: hypothetical protein WC906_03805 [Parcubacteria group bacterium]|jgi:hypothetical protein